MQTMTVQFATIALSISKNTQWNAAWLFSGMLDLVSEESSEIIQEAWKKGISYSSYFNIH